MFHSNHFATSELVPPEELARWGNGAMMLINPLLVLTIHTLRRRKGRFIVNSKARGREQSGIRTIEFYRNQYPDWTEERCLEALAETRSAHFRGDAADLIPLDCTVEECWDDIRNNPDVYPFLHFVETGISWLHIDVRNQPDITFWNVDSGEIEEVVAQKPFEWHKLLEHVTEADCQFSRC